MEFNGNLPRVICLDINSCFATIEQQANPILRNKPVVVAAYATSSGCILAASIDAKKIGIKTGMRVGDAKKIFPRLTVLIPDPPKYRFIHKKIKNILKNYSDKIIPKSIDEFIFEVKLKDPIVASIEIKDRIKKEVGEYITVSIGISTNSYLAKVASNLKKPDGLSKINKNNFEKIFSKLKLTDLTGIKKGNSTRLKLCNINTVMDFYNAPLWKLKLAFGGIVGLYWHQRLHGYEIDNFKSTRKTYGNSYAPPLNKSHLKLEILSKLCQKTGHRLRDSCFVANGVCLGINYRDGSFWQKSQKTKNAIFENRDIYREVLNLLKYSPKNSLPRVISVNVFGLQCSKSLQLDIFSQQNKKSNLSLAIDSVNSKWGLYTIYYARMAQDPTIVQDRISFGQL